MTALLLRYEQATDSRILALAHQRAQERGCPIVIEPPAAPVVSLTREQAADPVTYRDALTRVNGDRGRLLVTP